MEQKEVWKDVIGYEGLYMVSNLGRVKSLSRITKRGRKHSLTFLKQTKLLKKNNANRGYKQVSLCKNGKIVSVRVCRLVAEAFVPNPNKLPQVNHINEIKDDDRASNLEWCTPKYNINYGTRTQRQSITTGKPVIGRNIKTGEVVEYSSAHEAEKDGFTQSAICQCCNHAKYFLSHKGYTWEYKEKL